MGWVPDTSQSRATPYGHPREYGPEVRPVTACSAQVGLPVATMASQVVVEAGIQSSAATDVDACAFR